MNIIISLDEHRVMAALLRYSSRLHEILSR